MWHLNCIALNQPESSNFLMYIIMEKNKWNMLLTTVELLF